MTSECESFMKTLKREEIYARDYRDLDTLLESVEGFIENYITDAVCIQLWLPLSGRVRK